MDSVEDFAWKCANHEEVSVNTLSEWIKSLRSFIRFQIRKLDENKNTLCFHRP